MEAQGFSFEAAEASVIMMLKRQQPGYQPPFELIDFSVIVEHRQGRGIFAEATVKVRVGGEVYHTAAEGNGPVARWTRRCARPWSTTTRSIEQIPPGRLQGAHPRQRQRHRRHHPRADRHPLDSPDRTPMRWSTVGASGNIIEASWQALKDAYDYGLAALASDGNGSGWAAPTRSRRSKYRPRSPDFYFYIKGMLSAETTP